MYQRIHHCILNSIYASFFVSASDIEKQICGLFIGSFIFLIKAQIFYFNNVS